MTDRPQKSQLQAVRAAGPCGKRTDKNPAVSEPRARETKRENV